MTAAEEGEEACLLETGQSWMSNLVRHLTRARAAQWLVYLEIQRTRTTCSYFLSSKSAAFIKSRPTGDGNWLTSNIEVPRVLVDARCRLADTRVLHDVERGSGLGVLVNNVVDSISVDNRWGPLDYGSVCERCECESQCRAGEGLDRVKKHYYHYPGRLDEAG